MLPHHGGSSVHFGRDFQGSLLSSQGSFYMVLEALNLYKEFRQDMNNISKITLIQYNRITGLSR